MQHTQAPNASTNGRNCKLTSIAGKLRARGLDQGAILAELLVAPERAGLPESECRTIAESISRKPPGKPRPEPEQLARMDPRAELATRRGWKREALEALGAESEGRSVLFPMRDASGKIVGQRIRRADGGRFGTGEDAPKAISRKGGRNGLICPWPFPEDGLVLVVEGEADAAAALSAGARAVVGTPGARPGEKVFTWAQQLLAGRRCVLAPDPGTEGEEWLQKTGSRLDKAGATVLFIPASDRDLDERLAWDSDPVRALLDLAKNAVPWERLKAKHEATTAQENDTRGRFTDAGNAARFALEHRGRVAFVPELLGWYAFDPKTGTWRCDAGEVGTQALAKRTAKALWGEVASSPEDSAIRHAKRSNNAGGIRAMIDLARSEEGIAVPLEDFDADPFALAVANGVLDLRTGTLHPHAPERRITKGVAIRFDPNARAPRWEQFLEEVFDGDLELVRYIQHFVGYALTGSVREQVFAILWGSGCNGKSLMVGTIAELLGDLFHRADANLLLQSAKDRRAGEASPEIAALRGARLAVCSETGDGRRLNEALLKELTGGDRLTGRALYAQPISFMPTHKLLLVTNHRPKATDDPALWRRVRLIPFRVSFEGREDRQLEGKLRSELPGILAWAVRGCLGWQARGLDDPAAVLEATKGYRSASDTVGLWIGQRCELGPAHREQATRLFEDFETWCNGTGERACSQNAFGRRLGELGFPTEGSKPIYRRGLRLAVAQ